MGGGEYLLRESKVEGLILNKLSSSSGAKSTPRLPKREREIYAALSGSTSRGGGYHVKRPEVSVVRDTENSFLSLPPRGGGACLWGRLSKRGRAGGDDDGNDRDLATEEGKKGWRWIITDERGPKGRRGRRGRRRPPVFLHAGVTKWLATAKREKDGRGPQKKLQVVLLLLHILFLQLRKRKGGGAAGFACSEKGEGRNFRYATLSTLPR